MCLYSCLLTGYGPSSHVGIFLGQKLVRFYFQPWVSLSTLVTPFWILFILSSQLRMCALESRASIAKLSNSNYQNWKFKAEMVLIRDDLWDIVIQDIPTTRDSGWLKKNNQARASIGLMVEDDQLTNIRQYENAHDIWIALRNVHERSNLCSKLFLLRKLYKKRLDKGQSMREHINAMLETVDQLRALGEELKDSHAAALLLCSLPESYSTLITALEARPESELTLDFVRGKLLDEYDRRRENESTFADSDEVALRVGQNQRNYRTSRELRSCYFCHKVGHMKKNCHAFKAQKQTGHRAKVVTAPTSGNSNVTFENSKREMADQENYCFGIKEERGIHDWYIDSGATSHMTSNKSFFADFKGFQNPIEIFLADGGIAKALGSGNGVLKCEIAPGEYNSVNLSNVLYVPSLDGSLLSVKTLASLGFVIDFNKEVCRIMHEDKTVAKARLDPLLYKLEVFNTPIIANIAQNSQHNECLHLWHRRLGHRNPLAITRMHDENLVSGLKIIGCNHYSKCIGCIKGKTTNKPFPKMSFNRATEPFQMAHSDVCGPMKTPTVQGKRYILSIIDDFSRYSVVYLMKYKNESESRIREYIAMGKNKFQRLLLTLRTDGGGEYFSMQFSNFLKENGIDRQVTVPHSPQQNGVAERKNRSLIETARCMLFDAQLSNIYWGEAVVTANYIQNRLIHKSCNQTPYQLWTGKVPDVSHIKVFGCEAHAFVPAVNRHKFDSTTREGILLGYSECSKGYRIMLKHNNRVITSRTVKFIEGSNNILPMKEDNDNETTIENESFTPITINPPNSCDIETIPKEEIRPEIRVSTRINKGIPASRYGYKVTSPICEPESWDQMMALPTTIRDKWIQAANEEMEAMDLNKTWDLVELPNDRRSIASRWVFKMKPSQTNGTVYRARLVAKGYLQRPGEDFDAVFAPVVHYTTVRTLLSIAAKTGMETRHLDAKSAFLQGNIEEELYMDQPTGFIQEGKESLVCKLRKSIYGLKQSARIWNHRINEILLNMKFTRGDADNCLYIRNENGSRIFILLYVDDLLICADSENTIKEVQQNLQDILDIKDLGPVSSYLGINIEKTPNGEFTIDQKVKIHNMLEKFGMLDANTPMEPNFLKISDDKDSPLPNNTYYREIIGTLLYLCNTTRPDISVATGIMARRVETPTTSDLTAVKRIVRYLKKTMNKRIMFKKELDFTLQAYADADWAGDTKDRKSTSGQVFLFGQALIAWNSRKQGCVSLSSTEAEFVSAAFAAQEAIWIKRLLGDFGYIVDYPLTLFEDNQGCIALAVTEKLNARTKHMDVRLQFLRDLQNEGTVSLTYCPTEEMLADILTKPLPVARFNKILQKLGLEDNAC